MKFLKHTDQNMLHCGVALLSYKITQITCDSENHQSVWIELPHASVGSVRRTVIKICVQVFISCFSCPENTCTDIANFTVGWQEIVDLHNAHHLHTATHHSWMEMQREVGYIFISSIMKKKDFISTMSLIHVLTSCQEGQSQLNVLSPCKCNDLYRGDATWCHHISS